MDEQQAGGGYESQPSIHDEAPSGDIRHKALERAGEMRVAVANALDSGADKLRARGNEASGSHLSANAGSASIAIEGDGRMAHVSDKVADGMHATADWLRDADLSRLRADVEAQVREHPGRTLLIALGVGYLLGKALKK